MGLPEWRRAGANSARPVRYHPRTSNVARNRPLAPRQAMKKFLFEPPSHPRTSAREVLVPASVRIAREKIVAKLQAAKARATAKAKLKAAREEREIARAALRIARALDRKAAQKEREAAKLDREAQRVAFHLARRDRLEEQRLLQRARRDELKRKRRKHAKKAAGGR